MPRGKYDMTDVRPRFRHDCQNCVFLGRYTCERPNSLIRPGFKHFDLYFCNAHAPLLQFGWRDTVVGARFANRPGANTWQWALLSEAHRHRPHDEALRRAKERGLL